MIGGDDVERVMGAPTTTVAKMTPKTLVIDPEEYNAEARTENGDEAAAAAAALMLGGRFRNKLTVMEDVLKVWKSLRRPTMVVQLRERPERERSEEDRLARFRFTASHAWAVTRANSWRKAVLDVPIALQKDGEVRVRSALIGRL